MSQLMLRVATFRVLVLSAILITFAFAPQSAASAQEVSEGERLVMYSRPAVVRIYDGYIGKFYWPRNNRLYSVWSLGKGTGFFINPNGYIITNAHVTAGTYKGAANGKRELFMQFVRLVARDEGLNPDQAVYNQQIINAIANQAGTEPREFQHIHKVVIADGSEFPFEIKQYGAPVGQGKDVAVIKIEVKNAPTLRLGDSDKVQLQQHITIIGYPGAADVEGLDDKSKLEPTVNDGKVSAKKNLADGAPVLQHNVSTTGGYSGSPAFNDRGEVIGMHTFSNAQRVTGFAFVIPTNTVMEFVKQAGVTNEPGLTDRRYREGLELYWTGYYSRAIKKFEEVKRLFPQHPETEQLIRNSQLAIDAGKERMGFFGWFMILAAVGAVCLLFLGGGVALLIFTPQGKRLRAGLLSALAPAATQDKRNTAPLPQMVMPAPTTDQTGPVNPAKAKTEVLSLGKIAFTGGALAGQQFEIPAGGVYIGRDDSLAQVVIADSRVSKRHLWIGVQHGRVTVVDQGSTNGTFLNTPDSERVTTATLNPGDTIFLSGSEIAFTFQPPAAQSHLKLVHPAA